MEEKAIINQRMRRTLNGLRGGWQEIQKAMEGPSDQRSKISSAVFSRSSHPRAHPT